MSATVDIETAPAAHRARTAISFGSRNILPILGACFVALILILAIFGNWIAPHDPEAQSLTGRLMPPVWQAGGSSSHLLGTDSLGRDLLSRIIVATRVTLLIGFGVVALELIVGGTLGVLAGYIGGRVESVIMRWLDIQMGFPSALIYIFVILVFGQSLYVIIIAMGLIGWLIFGRIIRVAVKRVRTAPFVESATISGSSPARTIWRHVVPQIRGELMTLYLLEVGRVMLAESTLSFLGLGVQPPHITWGLLIGGAQAMITIQPWMAILPGLMIVFTVVSLNLVAGWVESLTDARQRRQK